VTALQKTDTDNSSAPITASAEETTDFFMVVPIGYKTLFVAGIGMILIFMLILMVHTQGASAFNRAIEADNEKNPVQAAAHYEAAIRWYLPFQQRIETAVRRLWEIGRQAEERGENHVAQEVYHRLRSSLYAIQSFYAPYKEWIARCDQKIGVAAKDRNKGAGQFSQQHADTSQKGTPPRAAWSLAMIAGFWGWVFSTLAYIRYGFEHNRTNPAVPCLGWLGSIFGFYGIWLISLAKA
jgi:hypothetical protein